jgi:Ser/Thr protein kinase RdoA (MazF antagonist)
LGRLLGRVHSVGNLRIAQHRIKLSVDLYGWQNIEFLLSKDLIDRETRSSYERIAKRACDLCEPILSSLPMLRLHGDCHLANVIKTADGPALVDFDDMVLGPAVQDIWLLVPGRDNESKYHRELLLEAYETFHPFPRSQLAAIEALRTLRLINYTSWLARRWHDPAFQNVFTFFSSPGYWARHVFELEDQVRVLSEGGGGWV